MYSAIETTYGDQNWSFSDAVGLKLSRPLAFILKKADSYISAM